jgi:hypothetical protein
MKLKALFLALAVAGAGASFALADDSNGGSTTTGSTSTGSTTTSSTTTGSDCRHFHLSGTLASVSATSFSVTVTKGSDAVKSAAGSAVTVAVTADTRVSWSGRGTLTGPNVGDSVKVNGKQCGTALTAGKVQARGPKPEHGGKEAESAKDGSEHGKQGDEHGKKSHK